MRWERNWPRHGGRSTTIRTQLRDRVEKALRTRVDDRDSSLIAPDDTVSSGVEPQSTLRASFLSPPPPSSTTFARFCPPDCPTVSTPTPPRTTRHDQGKLWSAGTCVVLKHPEKHTGLSRIRTKIHGTHWRVLFAPFFFSFCRLLPFFSLVFSPIDSQRRRSLLPVFITL